MEAKIQQMNKQKNAIVNFATNTSKTAKAKQTKGFLQARRILLEQYWAKYISLYDEIVCLGDTTTCNQDDYQACETSYSETMGALNDQLDTMGSTKNADEITNAATHFLSHNALPRINLPTFDGSYLHWYAFKDMFVSMVTKNTSLCNTQRLQYLKDSLKGDAQHALDNITTTDGNFSVAWTLLESKYENKRVIVNAHLTDMMNLPQAQKESATALRMLSDGITSAVRALEQLGRATEHWDDWLVYLLVHKMDPVSRKAWELSLSSTTTIPTYDTVKKFIENRVHSLEVVQCYELKQTKDVASSKNAASKPRDPAVKGCHTTANQCVCCTGQHSLYACESFRGKPVKERYNIARSHNLCYNCLHPRHQGDCPSKFRCKECKQSHHSQLHEWFASKYNSKPQTAKATVETPFVSTPATDKQTSLVASHNSTVEAIRCWPRKLPIVILGTALVEARADDNRRMILRALVDPGAEATFVSESVAQQLRLKRTTVNIPVNGATGNHLETARSSVKLVLCSLNSDYKLNCLALVLPRVGNMSPSTRVKFEHYEEFQHLQLADPKFYEPAPIDMILSAADYAAIVRPKQERSPTSGLMAQETMFGWLVLGGLTSPTHSHHVGLNCHHANVDLNETLQRFWALEEVDIAEKPTFSHDELLCEQLFDNTTQRDESGRYIVRLPVKPNVDLSKLNSSKPIALASLRHGLRRLDHNETMRSHYNAFMSDYESLGHMERVKFNQMNPTVACYLPHHGVWKESSTTTKLRVVFNAAKEYNEGLSLNDCLHIGPKLQNDLVSVILNWRRYRIAFTGDIEKMYRQIGVNKKDVDLQRIFWSDSTATAPVAFRLLTVTYGTNCAPYLAIKVLRTLAAEYTQQFPDAAWTLVNEFYVDDVLSGGDNPDDVAIKWQNLQALLSAGGFPLRKFNSNSSEVIKTVDKADREYAEAIELNWDGETKALGIVWLPSTDEISYRFHASKSSTNITKRQLASDVAKLFDPLGLIAPSIICGKIMLQELWKTGLNWDDVLPNELLSKWLQFRDELEQLNNIKVPRWVAMTSSRQQSYEIHVFADASLKAFAAVAYLRVNDGDKVSTTLLMAKTKVAPLKKIAGGENHRLELCAALLASRLLQKLQRSLRADANLLLWSDSRTVLCWLRMGPGTLKQFEANRVTEILQHTTFDNWRYVPTKENPADLASRGATASQLINHELWWNGPPWLAKPTSEWPDQKIIEKKTAKKAAQVCTTKLSSLLSDLLEAYSNIDKLLAVVAWCLRFIAAKRRLPHTVEKFCTWAEKSQALQLIVRYVQQQVFTNELKCLQQRKKISKQSPLFRLNPVVDGNNIVRLGGRLAQAGISESARFPIILPKDGPLTQLLIAQAHQRCLHAGTTATLHYLRQKVWIIDGRRTVKRYISKCVICFRQKSTAQQQLMGNLPAPRCNPSLPFLHTGVDYAGPFNIRTTKGRGHRSYKGYIALFVCLATRAIHLELVSDLTTRTFLDALHRFVSCRGLCSDLYSDQGTTFIGADAFLKSELAEFKQQLSGAATECATLGINWHFIPPAAPNFGGLWEAGVKSVKWLLKRIINTTTLTFEEFYTVLKKIEACLNSRPLARINDDPNDLKVLTPGHFLVGRALTTIPEPSILDQKSGLVYRWKLLRQLHQDFWRRWSSEYLYELQTRTKWHQAQQSVAKGQVVLLRDERLPPCQWSLGVIDDVHPGQDGLVRVVSVRTSKTTFKRPVSKISVLPIADNASDAHNDDG